MAPIIVSDIGMMLAPVGTADIKSPNVVGAMSTLAETADIKSMSLCYLIKTIVFICLCSFM